MNQEYPPDAPGPDPQATPPTPPPLSQAPLYGASMQGAGAAPWPAAPRKKRRSVLRWLLLGTVAAVLLMSIGMYGYLLVELSSTLNGGLDEEVLRDGDDDQTIAFYRIEGVIDAGAVENFRRFHNQVFPEKSVRAVVLRVDSPGGTLSASDQIYALIHRLKGGGKKVVVSMGGIAASGGYYISAPAHEIVAEPTTWTGSIGVIMEWPILKGALDKLGIEPVVLKSRNARGWKDDVSFLRKPDDRQRVHLQKMLDKAQERFEEVVSDGRGIKLKLSQVRYHIQVSRGGRTETVPHTETAPFNGKIYLAEDARDIGLVDRIGYQNDAIDRAASLANLSDPRVVVYRKRQGLRQSLFGAGAGARIELTPETLDRLQIPKVKLLWKAE